MVRIACLGRDAVIVQAGKGWAAAGASREEGGVAAGLLRDWGCPLGVAWGQEWAPGGDQQVCTVRCLFECLCQDPIKPWVFFISPFSRFCLVAAQTPGVHVPRSCAGGPWPQSGLPRPLAWGRQSYTGTAGLAQEVVEESGRQGRGGSFELVAAAQKPGDALVVSRWPKGAPCSQVQQRQGLLLPPAVAPRPFRACLQQVEGPRLRHPPALRLWLPCKARPHLPTALHPHPRLPISRGGFSPLQTSEGPHLLGRGSLPDPKFHECCGVHVALWPSRKRVP